MDNSNQTAGSGFILIGLSSAPHLQAIYFFLFFVMYVITLSGNVLLIAAVKLNIRLQTPMYFFLVNLAFIDICLASTVVPHLLVSTLTHDLRISLLGCATQMFLALVFGAGECMILAVMSFDRYAAICKPLHYNNIMNKRLCILMVAVSWATCCINSAIHVGLTFQLPYCRSRHVDHFFCEIPPFFRLSCRDTWLNEVAVYVSAITIVMCCFILTLTSYAHIVSTVVKIRSSQGRQKAFSTCASHLTVITLYYGTIMFMYMRPRAMYSPNTDKTTSILYTAVTPMVNPIIYSIRNENVKGTIKGTARTIVNRI
ncbi:olfactory receptor 5V1-like [Pelodytes ibericus]